MKTTIVIIISILAVSRHASGATIVVPPGGGGHLISAHSPVGQTFTAEDSFVKIGLHIEEASVFNSSDSTLLMQLFAGDGVAGQLLDSRMLTPSAGFFGYVDADFSNLTLIPGNHYSVTLSSSSDRWVSNSTPLSTPDYGGGVSVIQGLLWPNLPDKAFRVVPIPEPGTMAMIAVVLVHVTTRRSPSTRRRD